MRITVRFQDGAIEEFDTNTLTTDSALGRMNALTDLRVVLEMTYSFFRTFENRIAA